MKRLLTLISIVFICSALTFAQNLTDVRDGKVYKTVKINNQIWMAENLAYASENSWCYNSEVKNCNIYGRLYTMEAALKACPNGWRLPNDNDWESLVNSQGTKHTAGGYLKETGQDLWRSPNSGATNESGFTALPAGRMLTDGSFAGQGNVASFWSVFNDNSGAWGRHLMYDAANLNSYNSPEFIAYSIRCIKQ